MSDPWFLDENFDGVPDEFFDDFMAHFDFPLEDVDPGVDWNANFQSLEPPPLSVLSDLSAVTKNNSIWYSRSPQPKQLPSSGDSSSCGSIILCSNSNDVKESKLFQTSSPVSVLESSSSCLTEIRASINPKLAFPMTVKRTRSKRRPISTVRPQFVFPFISPASSASEEYNPATASDSGSESNSEKPSRKKQKRKKNLTMLSCSRENKKPNSQRSVAIRKCTHCEVTETPQWREGPLGPKTLCNACGVRYRSGRLLPEYRPAASPTFVPSLHSNSHKRVLEMRNRHWQ
ncbi:GATA transcription factor 11-like [Mangifera indica]|uniref:GATA transcription factor 11-like n=1 Tax=Mangifera indica TaxID=29780 RepID=UPI001CFAA15C|nr:GATA transcription factor 11-like [Mangifera indica]XP_044468861.1 GATA transcription factor 11-like [Mangifera indica]XP_044468869.1 GATA transcription factor 11-like [Mangifera indica]